MKYRPTRADVHLAIEHAGDRAVVGPAVCTDLLAPAGLAVQFARNATTDRARVTCRWCLWLTQRPVHPLRTDEPLFMRADVALAIARRYA